VGAIKNGGQKQAIFDHISGPYPRQKFKNQVGSFFGINMKSLYTKFQPSSFLTVGVVTG